MLEGPAVGGDGNIYFTDRKPWGWDKYARIYKWDVRGNTVSLFVKDSGDANGLYFTADGDLVACQNSPQRIASYALDGTLRVVADEYKGKPFNKPNDLWIHPTTGGVFFTDPLYGNGVQLSQEGEYVYYVDPVSNKVMPVDKNLEKPNGVVGTSDGKTLYVADHGAGRVFKYTIKIQGRSRVSLIQKKLFAKDIYCDGMTLDERGNVYVTDTVTNSVRVFTPGRSCVLTIPFPEKVTNLVFGDKTLYFTGQKNLYSLRMQVSGATRSEPPTDDADAKAEASTSPAPASLGQCWKGCANQKKKSWSTKCKASFWHGRCIGCPQCVS